MRKRLLNEKTANDILRELCILGENKKNTTEEKGEKS